MDKLRAQIKVIVTTQIERQNANQGPQQRRGREAAGQNVSFVPDENHADHENEGGQRHQEMNV